jgi:twitching motility protein PilI
LISERFRTGAALLIDRSLGLRNPAQLRQRPSGGAHKPWVKAEYTDEDGGGWKELDLSQLVRHPEFLGVAS